MKKVTFKDYAEQLKNFAEKHGRSYKESSTVEGNTICKTLVFADGSNWCEVTTDVTEFWNTDNTESRYTA